MIAVLEKLEHHRIERIRSRKKLFKYLRENKKRINDPWLNRKIAYNYLGDLSDLQLIKYVKKVMRGEA
jgi:hypothetical protein